MPLVDCVYEEPRWQGLDLAALAERAARAALGHLGLAPDAFAIALLACSDARIAELNAAFRGKPVPTNVLSWPAEDLAPAAEGAEPLPPEPGSAAAPAELGDIAIAWETCLREVGEQGRAPAAHVTHLIVHGTLHLLGYDHIRDGDAALMERREVEILASLGLPDPYS